MVSCMTLLVSHIGVEAVWPTLLYNVTGICFAQLSEGPITAFQTP